MAPDDPSETAPEAAARLARDLLLPTAPSSDADGVPRSHLDRLAAAGLLGIAGPPPYGLPDPQRREVAEHLAGACGTSWFCWTQHHTPLAAVAASTNDDVRERWLEPLGTGRALAAVAVAHVRRPGTPAVSAARSGTGWRLDGVLDWVTSWSICDVVLVVAQGTAADAGSLVMVLLDPHEGGGVASGPPLRLAAMGGTWTCPVRLTAVEFPAERVVAVVDRQEWLGTDALRTANASPHTFGLARAVVAELARTGEQRHQPEAVALAAELATEVEHVRREAYALLDEVAPAEEVPRRLALRARSLELAVRATGALVTSRAGGAMRLSDPAQRWAREALFHVVQAQTAAGREASLVHYRHLGGAPVVP